MSIVKYKIVVMDKYMPMPAFAHPPTLFVNARFTHASIILNWPVPVFHVPGQPIGRSGHLYIPILVNTKSNFPNYYI